MGAGGVKRLRQGRQQFASEARGAVTSANSDFAIKFGKAHVVRLREHAILPFQGNGLTARSPQPWTLWPPHLALQRFRGRIVSFISLLLSVL